MNGYPIRWRENSSDYEGDKRPYNPATYRLALDGEERRKADSGSVRFTGRLEGVIYVVSLDGFGCCFDGVGGRLNVLIYDYLLLKYPATI